MLLWSFIYTRVNFLKHRTYHFSNLNLLIASCSLYIYFFSVIWFKSTFSHSFICLSTYTLPHKATLRAGLHACTHGSLDWFLCSCSLLPEIFLPSLCMVKLYHSLRHSLNVTFHKKLIVPSSEYLGPLFPNEYSICFMSWIKRSFSMLQFKFLEGKGLLLISLPLPSTVPMLSNCLLNKYMINKCFLKWIECESFYDGPSREVSGMNYPSSDWCLFYGLYSCYNHSHLLAILNSFLSLFLTPLKSSLYSLYFYISSSFPFHPIDTTTIHPTWPHCLQPILCSITR